MSITLINQYYNKVDDLTRYSGKDNEGVISREFEWLINAYCEKRNLKLIPQFSFVAKNGKTIRPDGTIKNALRIDYGYWESKANVDFEDEIRKKFNAGYPSSNILFENAKKAVLYQQGERVLEVDIRDAKQLDKILSAFTTYEHPEVKNFNKAVENFKNDIPKIVVALREMFEKEEKTNTKFKAKRHNFWELCQNAINPDISLADVNEMLIQHILTEEIFISIFSESQFHQENNIAKELYEVEKTFFVGNTKRELLGSIRNYYEMIKAQATGIVSHTEKQTFLKAIYENFYKAYNPKGADRLGIVYTPSEIVKFMLESTDFLLEKHFGKTLSDDNVDILDPATGTGTFICDLLEYIPKQYLARKYKHEIHANEVAILPYYIANLNIEYTFQNKMGYYEEFKNSCFVDTLDNIGGLNYGGKQHDMFGFSAENAERIKNQNDRKISVIIGNPPYNANQQNENDNNKNREYKAIDKRIKETYIHHSTAQKTKVYDMYSRFLRWASDRVNENGIIAFVTNSSFVDSKTYDGFRKCAQNDFNEIWIIDLKGNARTSGERRRAEGGNVFNDQIRVGVAIYFLVKNTEKKGCKIYYHAVEDYLKSENKISFLRDNKIEKLSFDKISPDKNNNWIDLAADSDWDILLPICSKEVKLGREEKSIFKVYSLGVVTARDEWVYGFEKKRVIEKVKFLIDIYNQDVKLHKGKSKEDIQNEINYSIKWTRAVKNDLSNGRIYEFDKSKIVASLHRPFVKKVLYFSKELNEMQYQMPTLFKKENICIAFSGTSSSKKFSILVTNLVFNHDCIEKTQSLPLWCYDKNSNRLENITDWALEQFRTHYQDISISKENIFHYVYAVLHNPAYRSKYELNLKREFPRIPFYTDFGKWAKWGQDLMALHIDYETVAPYALVRKDAEVKSSKKKGKDLLTDTEAPNPLFEEETAYIFVPKPKLKANKEEGKIEIDEITTLSGVPAAAWEYKLGNRCALEWILDQYKESKPSDATIAEHFNSYKFADYKESVIELLMCVCTVSVETQRIVGEMGE
jgi:predicted helicase